MGNFLLYSRRNCPYFYIRCEMTSAGVSLRSNEDPDILMHGRRRGELKKVNFTLQVSPEKINKEKAKNQLTFQNEFIIINERHRDVSTISDELLIQEKYSSG